MIVIAGALAVTRQVVKGVLFPDTSDKLLAGRLEKAWPPAYAESDAAMAEAHQGDSVCCGHCGGNK